MAAESSTFKNRRVVPQDRREALTIEAVKNLAGVTHGLQEERPRWTLDSLVHRGAQFLVKDTPSVRDVVQFCAAAARARADLTPCMAPVAHWMRTRDIDQEASASLMWSFAKSQVDMTPYSRTVASLVGKMVESEIKFQVLSNALWSLAKFSEKSPKLSACIEQDVPGFEKISVDTVLRAIHDADKAAVDSAEVAQSLANAIWALAKLRLPGHVQVVAAGAAYAARRFDLFAPSALNGLIWACSIEHEPRNQEERQAALSLNESLDAIVSSVSNHVDTFPPRELSNLLWSRAKASDFKTGGFCPADPALFRAAVLAADQQTEHSGRTGAKGWFVCKWTPLDVGMFMSAMAKVTCSTAWEKELVNFVLPDAGKWAARMATYIESHINYFAVHTMSNIVKGLGQMVTTCRSTRVRDALNGSPAIDRMLNLILQALWDKGVDSIRSFQLTSLLAGLAMMHWRDDSLFFVEAARCATNLLRQRRFGSGQSYAHCTSQLLDAFATTSARRCPVLEQSTGMSLAMQPVVVELFSNCIRLTDLNSNFRGDEQQTLVHAVQRHVDLLGPHCPAEYRATVERVCGPPPMMSSFQARVPYPAGVGSMPQGTGLLLPPTPPGASAFAGSRQASFGSAAAGSLRAFGRQPSQKEIEDWALEEASATAAYAALAVASSPAGRTFVHNQDLSVKNTFLEVRDPHASRPQRLCATEMEGQRRQELEEARRRLLEGDSPKATGSAEQRPGEYSLGSALHDQGLCKPCAFFHTKGCQHAEQCEYCHLCAEGELKRRKVARKREEQAERSAAVVAGVAGVTALQQRNVEFYGSNYQQMSPGPQVYYDPAQAQRVPFTSMNSWTEEQLRMMHSNPAMYAPSQDSPSRQRFDSVFSEEDQREQQPQQYVVRNNFIDVVDEQHSLARLPKFHTDVRLAFTE